MVGGLHSGDTNSGVGYIYDVRPCCVGWGSNSSLDRVFLRSKGSHHIFIVRNLHNNLLCLLAITVLSLIWRVVAANKESIFSHGLQWTWDTWRNTIKLKNNATPHCLYTPRQVPWCEWCCYGWGFQWTGQQLPMTGADIFLRLAAEPYNYGFEAHWNLWITDTSTCVICVLLGRFSSNTGTVISNTYLFECSTAFDHYVAIQRPVDWIHNNAASQKEDKTGRKEEEEKEEEDMPLAVPKLPLKRWKSFLHQEINNASYLAPPPSSFADTASSHAYFEAQESQ